MTKYRLHFTVIVLLTALAACPAFAATMITVRDVEIRSAPTPLSEAAGDIPAGFVVDVTHQAGDYWRVVTPKGQVGYVPTDALKQAKMRFGPLVPLLIAAATPLGKVVAAKAVAWFQKKFRIGDAGSYQPDGSFSPGEELTILGREDGWLQVQLTGGAVGFVPENTDLISLQALSYVSKKNEGIWANSSKIPKEAHGLNLKVVVRKTDGALVPPGSALKLGDEYRIYITPLTDCYVRITAETPDRDHVCQYYPNHHPGKQSSILFKAGNTYAGEMLPEGMNFKVARPLGAKDILRIEATTAGPFHYVAKGDGCASGKSYRGGGFSKAGDTPNPTAQIIVEYPILTTPK